MPKNANKIKSNKEQVKNNKIKRDISKSDRIFLICKVVHYLNDFI